jgi:putative phosphonate catabolism associated alcohol dehydrogenase
MIASRTALVQIFDGPGKPFRLESRAVPTLVAGEVLVSLRLATICGSDLHTVSGKRKTPLPGVLGHEGIGVVVELGEGRPDLKPGDRVTWSVADSCGICHFCHECKLPQKCLKLFKYGHASLNDGSGLNGCYASHIVLRRGTHIMAVPDCLSDTVTAPVNCALATMVNAVGNLPDYCHTAVIQGGGLLGLYGCALLRQRGVEQVFCVEIDPIRLGLASCFGTTPIDGRPENYGEARKEIMAAAPDGVDAVIEVAGVSALVPEGVALVRPGGAYIFVGMVHPESVLCLTGEQVIRKCLTIRGVHNYGPAHLDEAVRFLAATVDRYPYDSLVGPTFPLEHLERAIEEAAGQRAVRVGVKAS